MSYILFFLWLRGGRAGRDGVARGMEGGGGDGWMGHRIGHILQLLRILGLNLCHYLSLGECPFLGEAKIANYTNYN